MAEIYLNDILHLTPEQISNSKIGLNMKWEGKSHLERWYESDENNRDVSFTYAPYYGGKKNFYNGEWCFGFVRLPYSDDSWLLVSVGEITNVPDISEGKPCEHVDLPQFQGFVGRLIIRYHKGGTFSRYIFKMDGVINEAKVEEILPSIYEPIRFEGFENVHLSYSTLQLILDSARYPDYKAALQGVKGVYCLTDKKTGKCYIGSASGEKGVLQRWSNYIDSLTGGNIALIELYNKEGDQYFRDNFEYTLIETFDKNTKRDDVLTRESYWKEVFQTKENGYNRN